MGKNSEILEIRHRFALLIGVRDYTDPKFRKIPQTVHDVKELDKILTKFGYTVCTLHCDQSEAVKKPTNANIWGELKNIANMTGPGDLLLVYFGGHGTLDSDAAYLVPRDGRKSALRKSAIDLKEFKQEIINADAQVKILILDACHSGIGRDSISMSPEFDQHVFLQAEGTCTLASCRRGEVAYEHDKTKHGAFTHFLLEGLKGAAPRKVDRFITFDDLKNYVTYEVRSWAIKRGLQQWPNAITKGIGDPPLVELIPKPPPTPPEIISPSPTNITKKTIRNKIPWKILIPLIVLAAIIFIGISLGLLNNKMPSNSVGVRSMQLKIERNFNFYLKKGIKEYNNENEEAIDSFKNALEYHPNEPYTLYYLALTYKNLLNDETRAYEYLKKAVENGFRDKERVVNDGFEKFLGIARFRQIFPE